MDNIHEILSNALLEKWSFPSSWFVEDIDRHYTPVKAFSVSTINEMLQKARAKKRVIATGVLPPASEKLLAKPVLYWLVSVRDPISSIIADARDSYNVSINSMLNHKSIEIASKLSMVPDEKIKISGRGLIPKKRPSSVKDAITKLKTPECDVLGSDRWAAVAACVALDVGLVVETNEFADVVCWNSDIAWIDSTGGFTRMSEGDALRRIRDLCASLVNEASPSMTRLKSACACLQVAKPFKRSRSGLITDIKDRL